MDINSFKSRLRGGVRPNLFEVSFTFPQGIATTQFQFNDSLLIKASQIPASTLGNIDVPFMGRQIKIPGDRTFTEWNITVLNDVDFTIRGAFESWMNEINSHATNATSDANPQAIYGTANVIQWDRDGTALQEYVIRDVYPSELSPIELAFDTNDQLQEFQVTLQYNYWETIGSAGNTTPQL